MFSVLLAMSVLAYGEPEGKVVRVVDGDTVVVVIGGEAKKLRIIGVDTPETKHPNKPVERFGREASAFLSSWLLGKVVEVERSGSSKDRYGRELGYLRLDGVDVGLTIIEQGFGHAYVKYPFSRMDEYRRAESEARRAGRGLWGAGGSVPERREPPAIASKPCGALTKKGALCRRLVRGGGRCYQHR